MTTVPGHNNILPQSKIVQEVTQMAHASKPGADQTAAILQAQQTLANTSVQGSEDSERLKREKEKQKDRQARKTNKAKRKHHGDELALDPEATGRLLDTTA
jgi:hypothetical protein